MTDTEEGDAVPSEKETPIEGSFEQNDPDLSAIDSAGDTNLLRSGSSTSEDSLYPCLSNTPSVRTHGTIVETTLGPTYEDKLIEEIIKRLGRGDGEVLLPLSEREIGRAIALSGVNIFNADRVNRIKDRLLGELGYEWSPEEDRYVAIIAERLTEIIDTTASEIESRLEQRPQHLQDWIDEWARRHGLDDDDDQYEIIAKYAAYYVLLKATLAEVHDDLPEPSGDMRQALRTATDQIDGTAFTDCILDDVVWLIDDNSLTDLLEARYRLMASRTPSDDIGRLFMEITPEDSRKKLGQFRTPAWLGELMQTWATEGNPEIRILDPGIGSAVLSGSSYAFPTFICDSRHPEITGIDANQLAFLMGATALQLLDDPHELLLTDFFELTPDDIVEDTCVVCNPPYTRDDQIPPEKKTKYQQQIEQETGYTVHGKSPLFVYFFYHIRHLLPPGSRAVVLTPYYLDKEYGASLMDFLLSEYNVEALVRFNPDRESVFDGAESTALLTCLEVSADDQQSTDTRIIYVDSPPGKETLIDAVTGDQTEEIDWGHSDTVQQDALYSDQRWTNLFDPVNIEIDTEQLLPLSELATPKSMINTGWDDALYVSKSEIDEWDIADSYLEPAIRYKTHLQSRAGNPLYDYTQADWTRQRDADESVCVLYHVGEIDPTPAITVSDPGDTTTLPDFVAGPDADDSNSNSTGVMEYLEHHVNEYHDLPKGEQPSLSGTTPWYQFPGREPPPIVVPVQNSDEFQFVWNRAQARAARNVHGIYLDISITTKQMKALLAFLNSGIAAKLLAIESRRRQQGSYRLVPGDLEDVPVPDPRDLPADTINALAEAFDRLRDAARDDHEQTEAVIDEIDTLIREAF